MMIKMPRKSKNIHMTREQHRLMDYDYHHYIPKEPYDQYNFLKILSLKNKEKKDE